MQCRRSGMQRVPIYGRGERVMSSMHVQGDLEDRMIALGYKKRAARVMFVNEAARVRLEREEAKE